jgi:hypothetical protein
VSAEGELKVGKRRSGAHAGQSGGEVDVPGGELKESLSRQAGAVGLGGVEGLLGGAEDEGRHWSVLKMNEGGMMVISSQGRELRVLHTSPSAAHHVTLPGQADGDLV